MAEQGPATLRKLWFDGLNLTSNTQAIQVGAGVEPQDNTVYGDTARSSTAGLYIPRVEAEGLYGAAEPDATMFADIGVADTPITVGVDTGLDGTRAYFFKATAGGYQFGGNVGDMLRWTVSAQGRGHRLIGGTILKNGSVTSNGNGTDYQVGAVSAAQKLYAALHVVTVSGTNPTLDVIVRSAVASGMAGATTQITFTQATDTLARAQYATPVAGAITDTWWDASWTIGGTDTPTFEFVVVMGIL